jgi:hypothetical protein
MSYQVGNIIEYTTFDGSVRRVYVQSKEDNIKNGLSGFTGILENAGQFDADPDGYGVWGYDHQITRVLLDPKLDAWIYRMPKRTTQRLEKK